MHKRIEYGVTAREGLKAGIDKLANAVKVTLGPKGRCVVIDKEFGSPQTTKDGVTVAKEIELEDPLENMGARMIKEVASNTNEQSGDGTTSSTVLAQALISEGFDAVDGGFNPLELKKGIDLAVDFVSSEIKKASIDVTPEILKYITTISANSDDELGSLVADALTKVTINGVINIEESTESKVEIIDGLKIDNGYISEVFVTSSDSTEIKMDNPYILIYNNKINSINELKAILDQIDTSLFIVCPDVDVVTQKILGEFSKTNEQVCVINAPGFKGYKRDSWLYDIALATGGYVIDDTMPPLNEISLGYLGKAEQINCNRYDTIIKGGDADKAKLKAHVDDLYKIASDSDVAYDKAFYLERAARLTGSIGTIFVGGASDLEIRERKDRAEDALQAGKAALIEGVVSGGGSILVYASMLLDSVKHDSKGIQKGIDILKYVLAAPLKTIAFNAGYAPDEVLKKCKADWTGFNAANGEYVDLAKAGIFDPAKVVRVALENAASIAGTLLITEAVVVRPIPSEIKPYNNENKLFR